MSRRMHYRAYEPRTCWVGESKKIIFDSEEEAEVAARVAEYDHPGIKLSVYHCDYGDHWHLTSE